MKKQPIWLIKKGRIKRVMADIDSNGNASYHPDPSQPLCPHFVMKKDFALSYNEAVERVSEINARYIINNIYKFAYKIDIINVST